MTKNFLEQFEAYQNIYFIGIGGAGISALARILAQNKYNISGSDIFPSTNLELLKKEGINIFTQHSEENISTQIQLVIYTVAITMDNPELLKAKQLRIPCLSYPEAVGLLTKSLKTIAICGTHGKTTTTAMLGFALTKNNFDPSVIVGALLPDFKNQNYRAGMSDWLILESCEYQDSFLNYSPQIIILNNIEIDHLDYFQNHTKYIKSFHKFISSLPNTGLLIANIDDPNIQKLLQQKYPFQIITFGKSHRADYKIIDKTIKTPNNKIIHINLQFPGQHNILNATPTIILSEYFKLDLNKTIDALNNFKGANRRFEKKGILGKTIIIDDYAHHPTEIRATINSCREILKTGQKLLLVFQPHQYSRTISLLSEFLESLQLADHIYIPNIYAARDSKTDIKKINAEKIVTLLNQKNPGKATYSESIDKTAELIKKNHDQFDIIVTMGAGDITTLSQKLLSSL